jgi:putative acetyltransferase
MEFRLATAEDYETTEGLTRESFWNKYQPGADEHYLLHKIRQSPDYLPELAFVAEVDGHLVGNIVYTKASLIESSGKSHTILTFGPVSVLPGYQGRGVGSGLIKHSFKIAKELGYPGVVIYGDPRYYGRLGFRCAERYEITTSQGEYAICLLAYPLRAEEWNSITLSGGYFQESKSFENFMEGFEEYERQFPEKDKFVTDSQREFDVLRSLIYKREEEGEEGEGKGEAEEER